VTQGKEKWPAVVASNARNFLTTSETISF